MIFPVGSATLNRGKTDNNRVGRLSIVVHAAGPSFKTMKISSQAFKNGGQIPAKYTKYGENHIPPIHLEELPANTRSLAMIVDDPDAPNGTFNHWLLFNMDPHVVDIKENVVPVMATQGKNDFGTVEYDGPMPPSGEHRYRFNAFALDTVLPLSRGARRAELEREMKGHVLGQATLMGKYAHPS